jgi:hypothetical protein
MEEGGSSYCYEPATTKAEEAKRKRLLKMAVGGWQVAVAAREVGGDRGPQVGCPGVGDADQAQLTNSRLEEILSVAAAVGAGVVMESGSKACLGCS